jgi:hypothetical protein
VEAELGVMEWLGCLRNHFYRIEDQCVLEVVGEFSLVMLREQTDALVMLRVVVEGERVIEGRRNEMSGFVEMVAEGGVHYCVVRKVIAAEEIAFDYQK